MNIHEIHARNESVSPIPVNKNYNSLVNQKYNTQTASPRNIIVSPKNHINVQGSYDRMAAK